MPDFYDASGLAIAPALAECRREFQFISVLVKDAASDPKAAHVRIQFNAVLVPHRQLLFWTR